MAENPPLIPFSFDQVDETVTVGVEQVHFTRGR